MRHARFERGGGPRGSRSGYSPNGGSSILFSAKNMDPNKQLSFMPELLHNGVLLGAASSTGFTLGATAGNVGVQRGHYLASFTDHVAPSGAGYTYRILVYEGTYGKNPTVVASGMSGAFTFAP